MDYKINEYHGRYNIDSRYDTVKYIVVHYVGAGDSSPGSALNNCIYFSTGIRNASAHYFIDDAYIYEFANPEEYSTWHCGDGYGMYGVTNQNSIGIEVCNNGGPFTKSEIDKLAWLVQRLMNYFGIPAENVCRHYDASGKHCPVYYVDNDEWYKLWVHITGEDINEPGAPTNTPSESFEENNTANAYKNPIAVDGVWGRETTKKLQESFGTPVDGEIWHQFAETCSDENHADNAWLYDETFDGSPLIKAMQAVLGTTVDGLWGPKSKAALCAYFETDSYEEAIMAMQEALNNNEF